jgi:hypothetical protein
VLQARERVLTPCSFAVFYLGFTFESLKELGARQWGLFIPHTKVKKIQQIPSDIWFTTICYMIIGYVSTITPNLFFFHMIIACNFVTKSSLTFCHK